MAAEIEQGFLVIADITGYTAYLSRSEMEHAPAIAADLLETVVGRLEPPFRLAKLEGDAAFVFAEEGRAEPALLLDAVEASYLAFRRRLRSIERATECECNACGLAPRLDLKVFVHHGSYVHSRIAGRDELAGVDVILAHRLLKGTTARRRTGAGFALFTRPALDALQVSPAALHLERTIEQPDAMGEIEAFVLDLGNDWQAESRKRRLIHSGRKVIHELRLSVPVNQATAWSYLTSAKLRAAWEEVIEIADDHGGGGGTKHGADARVRCVSGRLASIEQVVDWQPYDFASWLVAVPGLGQVETTADIMPSGKGSELHLRWSVADREAADVAAITALRRAKSGAFQRLAALLDPGGGVKEAQEVPS